MSGDTDTQPTYVFGRHEPKTLEQIEQVRRGGAALTALMADGHFGYQMPIGGVAAYRGQTSPAGVGFDIACGNAAILTDLRDDDWDRRDWGRLGRELAGTISFGIGRTNRADDAPVHDGLFDSDAWGLIPEPHREPLRDKARAQLGTVGSGNHYVDVFADEEGRLWVGVHFGSRGFGHTVASSFMAVSAGRAWGERVRESEAALLSPGAPSGQDYDALMRLAGEYAYRGREWVARKVVAIMGGEPRDVVHNHHNYAWHEEHGGERYTVVRKGATPAWPGQRGFVGGSMGDRSVILRGAEGDSPAQRLALYSTVHGAGRVMGRMQAKGKRDKRTGEWKRPPGVDADDMRRAVEAVGAVVVGGGLDEAPQVYRRLDDVLEAQGDTIEVEHWLTPRLVVMAGPEVRDPYKD